MFMATRRAPASAGSAMTRLYERAAIAPPGRSNTPCTASAGPAVRISQAVSRRPRQVSSGNKTSVISGREAPRPRNTTPSPYPAPCRAGSRDGLFGGNALGRACCLICRNSRRNHTAGTSEVPATSPPAPRIPHTPRMRDRCPIGRGTDGNTAWSGTARSTAAARIR
jgi:hypothetical protein